MIFNAKTDHPADIVDKCASVLDFLADMVVGRPSDAQITIGPEGINGLYYILIEVAETLHAATSVIDKKGGEQ